MCSLQLLLGHGAALVPSTVGHVTVKLVVAAGAVALPCEGSNGRRVRAEGLWQASSTEQRAWCKERVARPRVLEPRCVDLPVRNISREWSTWPSLSRMGASALTALTCQRGWKAVEGGGRRGKAVEGGERGWKAAVSARLAVSAERRVHGWQ